MSRAYFNVKVTRDVYIKMPKEDPRSSDPNVCGKLRVSMYGTRDAAQNLEHEYGSKLVGWGFIKGKSSPCVYYHPHVRYKYTFMVTIWPLLVTARS